MSTRIIVCHFSGDLVGLKRPDRTAINALRILAESPRVSYFDFSEKPWSYRLVKDLIQRALIVEVIEAYPWYRYELTDAGKDALNPTTTGDQYG